MYKSRCQTHYNSLNEVLICVPLVDNRDVIFLSAQSMELQASPHTAALYTAATDKCITLGFSTQHTVYIVPGLSTAIMCCLQ